MGQRSMKVSKDQEFVASDRWKCDRSPSGAHYWLIQSGQMTCKYCDFSKSVDTNRYGYTRPAAKQAKQRSSRTI